MRMRDSLDVATPYRLDLTVEALRRVPDNPVDVWTDDGRYVRALHDGDDISVVEVAQPAPGSIEVRLSGSRRRRHVATVAAMLGASVDLRAWYRCVRSIPWLAQLARDLRGLKPPRYPDVWEALCYGIIFQQLSIASAASIMHRFVKHFSTPVSHDGITLYPFPRPQAVARARESTLCSLGLSRMKSVYLKGAANDVLSGTIAALALETLSSDEAIKSLCTLHGIGRWSAAVVLLRGLGRLDVFPPTDSGAARSMKLLSGDPAIDSERLLATLDGTRGMLYFHLLLGALRKRAANAS